MARRAAASRARLLLRKVRGDIQVTDEVVSFHRRECTKRTGLLANKRKYVLAHTYIYMYLLLSSPLFSLYSLFYSLPSRT